MRYNAFLSYSHAVDGKLAPAVQQGLARLARPWYRIRALRVFRDKTSLSATPALWLSIEKALSEAEWFLLLASPESADSPWVHKEIDWWLSNRAVDKMLVLLSSGELAWDDDTGDFDWSRTTALSDALEGRFENEPLWVDLRWAQTRDALSLRHSRFREAILDVAAPLRAIPKEDLDGEDVRQHRRTLTAAWGAIIAIVLFAAVAEWQRESAVAERDSANDFLGRLQLSNGLQRMQENDLWSALTWFIEAWRWDQENVARVETHAVRVGTWLRNMPLLSQVWFHKAPVNSAEFSPDGSRIVTASGFVHRNRETPGEARVWDSSSGAEVSPPLRHSAAVYSASFSPDGSRVVTASHDQTVAVWNADTGERLVEITGHRRAIRRAVFSPDGRWIATASADQTARVWNAETGESVSAPLKHRRAVWEVAFSPDGKRLLTTTVDPFKKFPGEARLWDPATGRPLTDPMETGHWIHHGEFSPDGRRLVTASSDGTAIIWDAATGKAAHPPMQHADRVTHASFSPDGRMLLTTSEDGTARIWRVKTGLPLAKAGKPEDHWVISSDAKSDKIKHAVFSPDGLQVATIGTARTARVWDVKTAEPLTPGLLHSEQRYPLAGAIGDPGETPGAEAAVSYSPGGLRLLTASWDGTARLWDLAPDALVGRLVKAGSPVKEPLSLAPPYPVFSPDGDRVAVIESGKTARVWDTSTGEPVTPPLVHADLIRHAAFSPDGTRLVTTTGVNYGNERVCRAQVWDAATGKPVSPPITHVNGIASASFGPEGRRLVTASYDKTARVWDVETGLPIAPALVHKGSVHHAAFSPDGRWVVTASEDRTARIWDAETGHPALPPLEHKEDVTHATFSPVGDLIVTTSTGYDAGRAQVWDGRSGETVGPPLEHKDRLNSAAFSPDGARIVTASADGIARVWHVRSGAPASPPLRHEDSGGTLFKEQAGVISASFSADGRWVVTAAGDGIARVWHADTGQPITPPLDHSARVGRGRFSRDSHRLLTGSIDGAARVWDLSPDQRTPSELAQVVQLLGGLKVDEAGALVARAPSRLQTLWSTLLAERAESFRRTGEDFRAGHERYAAKAEAQRDWASAVFHLDHLIASEPERPWLYTRRARSLAALGQRERAVESITTSIELGADDWQAWQLRGQLHLVLGRWNEAKADYAQAIALGINDPSVWCDHALLLAATGDLEGYHQAVSRLLERRDLRAKGSALIERVLRLLLLDSKPDSDKARALSLIDEWLMLDVYADMKMRLAGAALYRAGRLSAAVEQLERLAASQQAAHRAWTWLFLAMAKYAAGDRSDARKRLAQATEWLERIAIPKVREEATRARPAVLDLQKQPWWRSLLELETLQREVARLMASP